MCTYRVIKDRLGELVFKLDKMESSYLALPAEERKDYYLSVREEFNGRMLSDVDSSARFIFLNRTCYNGLYRVNAKGAFNVPHGKYPNPTICNKNNLQLVSRLLQKVDILCGDFEQTLKFSGKGSFFYMDPPYKPITATSSFTSYTKDGFGDKEQERLKRFCDAVDRNGSNFIESNSDPADNRFFDELYSEYQIKRVFATRMINSKAKGRGKLSELLITNIINY